MKIVVLGIMPILACILFFLLTNKEIRFKKIIEIIYFLLFALVLYRSIDKIVYSINFPQVWDFSAFYLWGKTAVGGYDFYKPENLHLVFNSLNQSLIGSDIFSDTIVDIGFLYPPPTILYFAPLGFLSYKTAVLCWVIVNSLVALGCIYLIYKLFLSGYKLYGLMLVFILFFTFLPVLANIQYAQTNFILLFYLLLMRKYAEKKQAGIFLALAFITKPYMLCFLFYFLLKKKWQAILYFAISCLVIVGMTMLLFGHLPFISYITDSPIKRLPSSVYFEEINQSLQSVLLRQNFLSLDKPIIFTYISIAGILLCGVYLLTLLKRKRYDNIWAVLLLTSLIFYPGTLSHYGVLLLFIIFQFFDKKSQLSLNPYFNTVIVGVVFYLAWISLFAVLCFLLLFIIFKDTEFFSKVKFHKTEN